MIDPRPFFLEGIGEVYFQVVYSTNEYLDVNFAVCAQMLLSLLYYSC